MSLLDSFTILFEADTSPLDAGLQQSRRSVDDLLASIRGAERQVDAAGQGMRDALSGVDGSASMDTAAAQAALERVAQTPVDVSGAVDLDTAAAEAGARDVAQALDAVGDAAQDAGQAGRDGLRQIEQQAGQTETSVRGVIGAFAAAAAGFLALDGAMGAFGETITELEALGRTADALDMPVEDVDAFSRAMVTMGGDAQGARDSLVDMAESMGEALQDAESARADVYAKLGISLRDANGEAINATEGILRLADAVQGMSQEEAIFRIKELGITDNRTVEMVLKGRKELERMLATQKEQSGVTKESVESARRYTEAMNGLKNAAGSAGQGLMAAIIPALTAMVEWLSQGLQWASVHKDMLIGFFGALAAVIAAVYLPAMLSAAAATLAATWPMIAIGAAIAAVAGAFALAYDDVMNFIDGNDSLIGQIFDRFPAVEAAVMGIVGALKQAWEGIKEFGGAVFEAVSPLADAFGGLFGAVGSLFSAFLDLLGAGAGKIAQLLGVDIGGAFQGLGSIVGAVMDGMVSVIKAAVGIITSTLSAVSGAISKVSGAVSAVASFVGLGGDDDPSADVAAGQAAIQSANASPLNATTSNAISNSVASTNRETNVQVGEVVVNTQATDAEGIARDVGGSLNEQLAQVDAEFSTGVAR